MIRVAHPLSFLCSVFCLRPVSCVSNVVSVSGLSILDFPSAFFSVYLDLQCPCLWFDQGVVPIDVGGSVFGHCCEKCVQKLL